jgi:hypothetical protein
MVKKHLEEKTYSPKEWNENIMPLVEKGVLKDRSKELVKTGLAYIYEVFEAVVEDTDGQLYRCVGERDAKMRGSCVVVTKFKK